MIQSLPYGGEKSHTEFHLGILSSVTPEMTCQGKRERINLSQWILVPWLCARCVCHCTVLPVIARGSSWGTRGRGTVPKAQGTCRADWGAARGHWHTQLGSGRGLFPGDKGLMQQKKQVYWLWVTACLCSSVAGQGGAGEAVWHSSGTSIGAPTPPKHLLRVQPAQKQLLGLWQFGKISLQALDPQPQRNNWGHAMLQCCPERQSNTPPCNSKANLSVAEKARPANSSVWIHHQQGDTENSLEKQPSARCGGWEQPDLPKLCSGRAGTLPL